MLNYCYASICNSAHVNTTYIYTRIWYIHDSNNQTCYSHVIKTRVMPISKCICFNRPVSIPFWSFHSIANELWWHCMPSEIIWAIWSNFNEHRASCFNIWSIKSKKHLKIDQLHYTAYEYLKALFWGSWKIKYNWTEASMPRRIMLGSIIRAIHFQSNLIFIKNYISPNHTVSIITWSWRLNNSKANPLLCGGQSLRYLWATLLNWKDT